MSGVSLTDVLALPIPERARLAQAIWDSIAEFPDKVPLSAAEREELDRRLAEHLEDPSAGSPWPEVRDRIFRKAE